MRHIDWVNPFSIGPAAVDLGNLLHVPDVPEMGLELRLLLAGESEPGYVDPNFKLFIDCRRGQPAKENICMQELLNYKNESSNELMLQILDDILLEQSGVENNLLNTLP